jgi:hypothetical protein
MARPTDPEQQLAGFLAKYSDEIAGLAEALRLRMRRLFPTALELVYDNYNALAIGYSPSDKASEAIFSIALYPRWVSLFFLQARGLSDPDHLLKGNGSVCKHVVVSSPDDLSAPAIKDLIEQALETAKAPFPAKGEHRLIIKSVSATQRPRRPPTKGMPGPRSARAGSKAGSVSRSKRSSSASAAKTR